MERLVILGVLGLTAFALVKKGIIPALATLAICGVLSAIVSAPGKLSLVGSITIDIILSMLKFVKTIGGGLNG